MKTLFRPLLGLGLGLTLLAPTLTHAAFSPEVVGADARWVVYADLNALRDSAIGKELIDAVQAAQFAQTKGTIGVDVPKLLGTIGSVTAYGANFSPDPDQLDGTLVLQGTNDLRKIAESLLLQANVGSPEAVLEVTDLPFPVYSIARQDRPAAAAARPAANDASAQVVFIAFPPEPVILVSKSKAQLLKARDVVRGSAASLKKTPKSPLTGLLGSASNSFLFAASVVPSEKIFPEDGPQARILQMTQAGAFALGENGTDAFAHAELHASSPAMADKLLKIVEGMTAMLSLAESSDQQLKEFLNSTQVAKRGETVTLDLSYSSARLTQMAKNLGSSMQAAPPAPPAPVNRGTIVGEWSATPTPNAAADSATPFSWQTIENVALVSGSTLTVIVRDGRNVARLEQVDIVPSAGSGGSPLSFRAEYMRLSGFRMSESVQGGPRSVIANGHNSEALLQFPGAAGTYTVRVAYAGDPAGRANFALRVKSPTSAAATPGAH